MPVSARVSLFCLTGFILCGSTACTMVPQQTYRQSQLRSMQLYNQNRALAMERDQARQQLAGMEGQLNVADRRLDNLNSERSQLQQRYLNILNRAKNQRSPLSASTTRSLEELQSRYPQFEFDPQSGVSKFHSDILFGSGSSVIKKQAIPLLRDFAAIMNEGDTRKLNILVVGHTDNKRIAKQSTRSKHASNWHLSTNRADSVVLTLSKSGIKGSRMGAAGYGEFQPLVPNKDEKSRSYNRRVEIFVLAPDAVVAGWDPATSRK